jgi:hypothetical protein
MRNLILILMCSSLLGCDSNLFSEMADTETDEAILFDANRLMGEGDWTGAIDLINTLSADSLAVPEVKAVLASAYAGRCGLNLIELALQIEDYASSSLFKIVLADQKDDPDYTDCQTAENLLKDIGGPAARTENENLLMALTSLEKIGAILAGVADVDNEGNPDAGFNACPIAPLTDALIDEMLVGFTHFATSMMQVTQVGGSLRAAMTTLCGTRPSICANYDATTIIQADRDYLRTVTHSSGNIGLNTNNGTVCP